MESIRFTKGVRSLCSFVLLILGLQWNVTKLSAQITGTLACSDQVNISLDDNCRLELRPDQILKGQYTDPISAFKVVVEGTNSNVVTLPGRYVVKVINTLNGNFCWGNILVEDKLAPVIVSCPCPAGNNDPLCRFKCSDLASVQSGIKQVPKPIIKELCGTVKTSTLDTIINVGCTGQILRRKFIYEDAAKNVSTSCISEYFFTSVQASQLTPPKNNINVSCGSGTSPQEIFLANRSILGDSLANIMAYPTVNGTRIEQIGTCSFFANWTDAISTTNHCGNQCSKSKKVIRTWDVIDWCKQESKTFVQIIAVTDNAKPTIQAPQDYTISTNSYCKSDIIFETPVVLNDDCSNVISYRIKSLNPSVLVSFNSTLNRWVSSDVMYGVNKFIYEAEDCCGNINSDTLTIKVIDNISPVAISREFVVVTLTSDMTNNGFAKVFVASINNGSHDACSPVKVEIRRESDSCKIKGNITFNADGHPEDGSNNPNAINYDPDNGEFVSFCCSDLNQVANGVRYGIHKVILRVWDDGDGDGVFGSSGDNYNEAWSQVRVEDKSSPILTIPDDVMLNCTQDFNDLKLTGTGKVKYNCGTIEAQYSDIANLNSCNIGSVSRKWFIKDQPNVFKVQQITIKNNNALFTYSFPKDTTVSCVNLPNNKISYSNEGCMIIGQSLKSDTFHVVPGACMKIINKYTLVDWCSYNPNDPNSTGVWRGTQVIKVIDNKAPIITCKNDTLTTGDKCLLSNISQRAMAHDNGDCGSKILKWIALVDLNSDNTYDYEYSSFLPLNDLNFNTDNNANGIPDAYLAPTSTGEMANIVLPGTIDKVGIKHTIKWTVNDGCGNDTSCISTFVLMDRKTPSPYCAPLSTAFMKNGELEIWASDFDKGSTDNCTASSNLLFTFNEEHPVLNQLQVEHYFTGKGRPSTKAAYDTGEAQRWLPTNGSSAKKFICKDKGINTLKVTVWDEVLNYDYCEVELNIIDNQGACDTTTLVNGLIMKNEDKVSDVMVKVINMHTNQIEERQVNGEFTFDNLNKKDDYKITVSKTNDVLNGISTLDLIGIMKHILGTEKLTDPKQMIAADVNNDGKINASDLIDLRRVILGVKNEFTNNSSWKFFAKNGFTDPKMAYSDWKDYQMVLANEVNKNMDFEAVKIGDVNLSARANLNSPVLENRSQKAISFSLKDRQIIEGKRYNIILNNISNTKALQMGLQVLGLEIESIKINGKDDKINWHKIKDTDYNILWVGKEEEKLEDLVISAKALKHGKLSEMIYINDNKLGSVVYTDKSYTESPLKLKYEKSNEPMDIKFDLLQNHPNPFDDVTTIGFYLPLEQEYTFTILDIGGSIVKKEIRKGVRGYNSLNVQLSQLSSSGVMYYKIESGEFSATKIMIGLK